MGCKSKCLSCVIKQRHPAVPSSARWSRRYSIANQNPNQQIPPTHFPSSFPCPFCSLSPPPSPHPTTTEKMYPKPDEETLISALNLWDDLWLQHNILSRVRTIKKPQPVDIFSSINDKGTAVVATADVRSYTTRALQRTPSLSRQQTGDSESSMTCKICTRKLRHSCSSLDDRKHSSYYSKNTAMTTPARHRPPRHMKLDGTKSDFILRQMSFRKVLDEKKCKSLSDLEFLEVQGFKDLGFDFSKGLNASLMKMIPGLRDPGDEEKKVRRPYLSEAWSLQKSAPPVVRWTGRQSAEDMKEQLKFWARNVACNVKQEC